MSLTILRLTPSGAVGVDTVMTHNIKPNILLTRKPPQYFPEENNHHCHAYYNQQGSQNEPFTIEAPLHIEIDILVQSAVIIRRPPTDWSDERREEEDTCRNISNRVTPISS